jgi:hypothetical protein
MNLTGQGVCKKTTKEEIGEDKKFLAWLRTQPCAICKAYPPNDPAHYRTAQNSGTGCKPINSAIPLCRDCHSGQHQIGQYCFRPREEWERLVKFYLQEWKKTL